MSTQNDIIRRILLLILIGRFYSGQSQNPPGTSLMVYKTQEPIILDGSLDEAAWKKADTATNFYQNYPNDSLPATNASEAFLTFDDQFLYFAFKCYTSDPTTQNLRRDFPQALTLHDVIYLNLGGFADKANAFWFGVSYPGVQYDGAITTGGDSDDSYSDFWDAKWYTKTKAYDGYWIAENAIPFKSFRYSNKVNWDINFLRGDANTNQLSHWVHIPTQYMVGSQAFQGTMITDVPLPEPGSNIVLIPYATGAYSNSNATNVNAFKSGFDAKVGISPSLNLDLTFNPDFSHVEVDQQVINLTRFEYNFPERRQFFLESSDLFGQLGLPATRPFFTRRIGLAADSTGLLQQVPILYGARLSGKPSDKWRVGLMNMHTQDIASLGLPDQNYTVGVAQYRVMSRSYFSGFMINKQSVGLDGEYDPSQYYHPEVVVTNANGSNELNTYNRVAGLEFNLLTTRNIWSGKVYYHRSFDSFHRANNSSMGLLAAYNTRDYGAELTVRSVDKNFRAETGFVPGLDVYQGFYNTSFRLRKSYYPKNSKLIKLEPYFVGELNLLRDGKFTDRLETLGGQAFFNNQSQIYVELRNFYQRLPNDFNPITPVGDSILHRNESYSWNDYEIQYQSDPRKEVSYSLGTGGRQFYNGHRYSIFGSFTYRFPPYLTLSTNFNYQHIQLAEGYGNANFLLISPKLDITFTPNVFFTTFVQYNDRFDNINLNARFQWRFQPVSDIFLVYTENYLPDNLSSKNRSLVLKVTYWFNL